MKKVAIDRKEFFSHMGKICLCGCALSSGLTALRAQEGNATGAKSALPPRSEKRMAFAEQWIKRFMDVLDGTLDEATRQKVMMANGKACYSGWIKETGRQIKTITLEQLRKWVQDNVKDDSCRIEGNTILFQYTSAAETGLPAPEGACLCPLVESKPAGMSGTYCLCSLGYVKEMYERMLGKTIEVALLDSVLRGGRRCQFKITVAQA